MDPISTTPEVPTQRDGELKQLRLLTQASAVSILILTGTIFIFFYRQVVTVRKNTAELVNYILEYENSSAREFIGEAHRKFQEFSRENPDFAPVYQKYFGTNEPPPPGELTNRAPAKIQPAPPR